MPVNKRSKYRGSRTCGGGTHKNRRGAGNRGGRGRAGQRDHNYVRHLLQGTVKNGKHGFVPVKRKSCAVMDIGRIDEIADLLVSNGLARREEGVIILDAADLGIDKILGSGRVTRPFHITAREFSGRAVEKIEERGGRAVTA
ncbi:MAG: uL15m family ribosomal protein [Methanoculleaceae archaeon]